MKRVSRRSVSFRIAFPLLAAILLVAACGDSSGGAPSAATQPATTQATTTTTLAPIATTSGTVSPPTTVSLEVQQDALAVAEAHIAAFNAGDRDAVMGVFTPDVSISDSSDGEIIVTDWEMMLGWYIAQGTTLTAADCTVAEASSPGAVTVTCVSGTHQAPAQAIGAPPTPTTLTFLVVPEGIRELELIFGEPHFVHTSFPMLRWLKGPHPEDVDRVGFGLWDSVEEAEQNGLLFAQYAEEWAAFLDASDCVYPDICFRILTEG